MLTLAQWSTWRLVALVIASGMVLRPQDVAIALIVSTIAALAIQRFETRPSSA